MIRVCFLTSTLDFGGAERQLLELVRGIDKTRFDITVISFHDNGAFFPELEQTKGVKAYSLHKQASEDRLRFWANLWNTVRIQKPDILHGYLDYPNFYGLLLGKAFRAKVVWGIRASDLDFSKYDWKGRWVYRLNAWLSRYADCIISNSWSGKQYHNAHGYDMKHMVVIPNGIDVQHFSPNRVAGERVRAEWGISSSEVVIGLVGRLNPVKGHHTFLQAAKLLKSQWPGIRFVCIGEGPESYKKSLMGISTSLDLDESVIWTGARQDMAAVYNAMDILTSASHSGEGFSNAIGEAMACGIPCVVTDVGDSRLIVGDVGTVVSPRDPCAIEQAWDTLLACEPSERQVLGMRARERIRREFGLQTMITKTEKLLAELVHDIDKLDIS